MRRREFVILLGGAAAWPLGVSAQPDRMRRIGILLAAPGMAQSAYPSRSIQIIVPFTAGGGNDLLARMLADKLQKRWGQPVIVENKPGAGGNIGTEAMLRMSADGYTLLLATNTMTIQAHLFKATPYNVRTDFAPLAKIATTPLALVVNPEKIPVSDVAGLLSYISLNKDCPRPRPVQLPSVGRYERRAA
jgi:tripartite-type tricarboxylate transporter receptor subunit TctC